MKICSALMDLVSTQSFTAKMESSLHALEGSLSLPETPRSLRRLRPVRRKSIGRAIYLPRWPDGGIFSGSLRRAEWLRFSSRLSPGVKEIAQNQYDKFFMQIQLQTSTFLDDLDFDMGSTSWRRSLSPGNEQRDI